MHHTAKRPSVAAFNATLNPGLAAAASPIAAQMDQDLPPSQGSSTATTAAKMEVVLLIDLVSILIESYRASISISFHEFRLGCGE